MNSSRLPSEFMPFQYNGTNGALRELSQRRDILSPERSTEEAPVRFARIKRTSNVDPPDGLLLDGSSEMVPGTPTDSYESSSVCSDLRGDQRDSGEDESVSERIFRKSFYTRFNNDPTGQSSGINNNNSNHHHHQHRRSVTSKELLADVPSSSVTDRSSHRRSMHRPSHHRDESAESVMVRKFLSSAASEPVNPSFERERRLSRHRPLDGHTDGSREPSVARSIKGEPSDSSSITSGSSVTRREPYTRSYTSRTASSDSGDHRRSFYGNPDHHISSLPRLNHRTNRYSIQEHPLPSSSGRSNTNPSSRYSSIFEESSMIKDAGIHGILSPTSSRRHPNLSEAVARRESTFYGGSSSTNRNGNSNGSSSSYYSRSTSTGLDSSSATSGTGGGNNNVSAYATMRPSYSRHRR